MRSTSRLAVSAVLAVLLAAVALAGCGSSGESGSDAGKLTYWAVRMASSVGKNEQILNRELATFTEQTGIEVDLEIMPWDSAYSRIMTAITSGRTPDVVDIGNTWSATLQATGSLLPFDDAAMEAIGGRDRFVAACMGATGAAGQPPASIPLYGQSYALFYNTKMFAAAGITEPPGFPQR